MTPRKKPSRQYLATSFRNVDQSGDTTAHTKCLDMIADIPFYREVKEESFRIIAGTDPDLVLDAGCGAGCDLCTLASILPAKSLVVGLDASASLLATAAERTLPLQDRCSLVRGDLLHVPFGDGTFSACRIDRVLQHIHDPAQVIRELVRVLEPGGTLVAFDNDWDTLSVSLDDVTVSARLARFWSDSFASGRIGKDLAGISKDAGLTDIYVEKKTLTLTDLPVAEKLFDIPAMLERMTHAGIFSENETTAIQKDLAERAGNGTFTSGYTACIVRGKKPE